jgi:hypothetical protein
MAMLDPIMAAFERDAHQGRVRAVARGQKMGRPFKLTDHQKREAIERRDQDGKPLPTSPAATTSARRRFHG